MMKLMGAVMVGFACAYLGIKQSVALKTRAVSLADIRASLELLESEINFSVNKLKKAFMRVDRNGLFALAAENMESMGAKKAWSDALREMRGKLCLCGADVDALLVLGQNIGRTDKDDQIKNIRYVKTVTARQESEAKAEYERFGKLYTSGGVLVGLLVVIALI